MKIYYISFGQVHTHSVNGKTFDKDCLCALEANDYHDAHAKAMEIFNGTFCFVYSHLPDMSFFPRGVIDL